VRADFDMAKHGYTDRTPQSCVKVPAVESEWSQYVRTLIVDECKSLTHNRLRKTGEWSDFTVFAQGKSFRVHRVRYVSLIEPVFRFSNNYRLCKESLYFKAVCSGGFAVSIHATPTCLV
jgi:hypothetical protein